MESLPRGWQGVKRVSRTKSLQQGGNCDSSKTIGTGSSLRMAGWIMETKLFRALIRNSLCFYLKVAQRAREADKNVANFKRILPWLMNFKLSLLIFE